LTIVTQKPRSGDEAGLPKNVASAGKCCGDTSLTDRHQFAKCDGRECIDAITATLTGSDTATALGLTAQSSSPVIVLCRQLLAAGHDPALPLHAYRGGTLAVLVRSIGEAARLEINAYGTGFRPRRGADAAPPIAPKAPARIGQRARRKAA
jgi:hypothetical protein